MGSEKRRWDKLFNEVDSAYITQNKLRSILPEDHMSQQMHIGICLALKGVCALMHQGKDNILKHLQKLLCPSCGNELGLHISPVDEENYVEEWLCKKQGCGFRCRQTMPIKREG